MNEFEFVIIHIRAGVIFEGLYLRVGGFSLIRESPELQSGGIWQLSHLHLFLLFACSVFPHHHHFFQFMKRSFYFMNLNQNIAAFMLINELETSDEEELAGAAAQQIR